MRRRDVITLLGGAAVAWPLAAQTRQRTLPVIGYLNAGSPAAFERYMAAFRGGLAEAGYVEGRNVAIDLRWANNDSTRLPDLAADLVTRGVSVIAAFANSAAVAAKASTPTIPIVFAIGGDPVNMGLVTRLDRPGGNITGASTLATETTAKMLEVLHQLVPKAAVVAAFINPGNAQADALAKEAREAARVLGLELLVLNPRTESDIETAFANLLRKRAEALVIDGDVLFLTRMKQLVVLTARHAIPAVFPTRDFPDAGGLMSYGVSFSEANRVAGIYAGRILKGEKPADLPVQRSTKVELVINLATARALGLTFPLTLLGRADEVIE
jgi:putative ABC transport system substrate-binding protein